MPDTALRRVRLEKGLTLTAMAEGLGILPSRLSMIETGQRPVSPDLATEIAGKLGVRVDDLFSPDSFTVREAAQV